MYSYLYVLDSKVKCDDADDEQRTKHGGVAYGLQQISAHCCTAERQVPASLPHYDLAFPAHFADEAAAGSTYLETPPP